MSDLVVYYTRTELTKKVSQVIAKQKDAKLLEVVDKQNRQGAFQFMKGALDAMRNKKTEIEYETINLDDYDTIYIGTPVWASKPTPAIIKFIEQNDFTNHDVVTFSTMTSNGGESTTNIMNESIKQKGGNIIKSFSIITKNTDIEQLTNDAMND